jgi:Xaa-Pro dipeptidase
VNLIKMDYRKRMKNICNEMKKNNVDYLISGPGPDMFYITGISTVADERMQLCILSEKGELTLLLPEMYKGLLEHSSYDGDLYFWSDEKNPVDYISNIINIKDSEGFALDDKLQYIHLQPLLDFLSNKDIVLSSKITGKIRMIKDEEEISLMKRAALIADRVEGDMADYIKLGMSEKEIAMEIEYRLKKYGGDDISFKPIVACGKNGSLPHHSPGDYRVKKGDFVTLDLGCVINEYCSDTTRTYLIGAPDKEKEEVYRIVQNAGIEAAKMVKPGVKCEDIDSAARDVISKAGYGEYFIHRTGHGIGLEVHENPFIVQGNKLTLRTGMAFSIEPGIYLPERFGVRVEDIVVVTDDGCEVLNKSSRELKVI